MSNLCKNKRRSTARTIIDLFLVFLLLFPFGYNLKGSSALWWHRWTSRVVVALRNLLPFTWDVDIRRCCIPLPALLLKRQLAQDLGLPFSHRNTQFCWFVQRRRGQAQLCKLFTFIYCFYFWSNVSGGSGIFPAFLNTHTFIASFFTLSSHENKLFVYLLFLKEAKLTPISHIFLF